MKKRSKTVSLLPVAIILLFFNTVKAQVDYEVPLSGVEYGLGFLLSWTTENDLSTDLFVVERSMEGQPFKSIGTVKGKQSRAVTSYRFKDLELGLKGVRYRLKEIGTDENSRLTNAITLTKEFVSYFEIVRKEKASEEVMEISVNSVIDGELECRVVNNMGDVLTEEMRAMKRGLNDFVFDLTSEIDGTYHMVFKLNNVMETVVFKKVAKEKKGNVAGKKDEKRGG